MALLNSKRLFLNSETYFTIPFEKPKEVKACAEVIKFLKFPTSAIPEGPIKMAMALEVKNPVIIFITIDTELSDAILNKVLFLIFDRIFFK